MFSRRLRKMSHEVPVNSRPGSEYYTVTYPGGVETRSFSYIPAHSEYYTVIQDENHARCYPKCGGPYSLAKTTVSYGRLNFTHGYDYIFPDGKHKTAVHKNGWVKPNYSFSILPIVAESGILKNDYGDATEPIDDTNIYNRHVSAGSAGYKRYRPKLERLNFIESIKELPETVRSLSKRAFSFNENFKKHSHKSGSSYVAAQFGYVPLVRDIVGLGDLIINSEKHIGNVVKNNGRWHTKGGKVTSHNESEVGSHILSPVSYYYAPNLLVPGTCTHTVSYEKKYRFKGTFRYYVPGIDKTSFVGRFSALTVLSGIRFTPSNIYNAIPWSWLLDWTTKAGDWVDNYSSQSADDCACKNAWIIYEERAKSDQTVSIITTLRTPNSNTRLNHQASATSTVSYEKKGRYGAHQTFSFEGGPLSDKQALILHSVMRGRV